MAKDPAVLFYTNDFLSGTFTMSDEQVGKYIRLLCIQHQKGFLTEKDMLNICKTYDEDIYLKFEIKDGKYINKRLNDESERRKNYSKSRSDNRKGLNIDKKEDISKNNEITYDTTYVKHMETETITINENEIKNEIKESIEKKINFEEVLNHWNSFAKQNSLPEIKSINKSRREKIINRSKESEFDFNNILTEIKNSDFLKGLTSSFKVNFDWIFKSENNYIKIIEGNYRNGKSTNNNTGTNKGFDIGKNTWIAGTLEKAIQLTGKNSN
jgi:hypothetical protein